MKKIALLALASLGLAMPAQAQFGKNKVVWEDITTRAYRSAHFDVYDRTGIKDTRRLEQAVRSGETFYDYLRVWFGRDLTTKPNIILYRTQSDLEATNIDPDFIPEGVLAFAEASWYRIVIKHDSSDDQYEETLLHELVHLFEYEVAGRRSFLTVRSAQMPGWFMEGLSEYLSQRYHRIQSDDLRRSEQRDAAANPEMRMPTLFAMNELQTGQEGSYAFGPMVFQFIEATYGESAVKTFVNGYLKSHGHQLRQLIVELTNGAVDSVEGFDELHRDFWRKKLAQDALVRPRPHEETSSFRGRHIIPSEFPNPLISLTVSPDGKTVAAITVDSSHGAVVATFTAPAEGLPFNEALEKFKNDPKNKNIKDPERLKRKFLAQYTGSKNWKLKVLTPWIPPKHYEYLRVDLEDSSLSWGATDSKPCLAFFARKGRDYALFIIDAEKGNILREVQIPLDQASSPSLNPAGTKVYFSAAKDTVRDIYVLDLASNVTTNLTNDDAFDTAPAVSPDNTKLVYTSSTGKDTKLFLLDLETLQKYQLTFGASSEHSPAWSHDGTTVVYTSDGKDRLTNLYTLELATSTVRQWTDFFSPVLTPVFADNGARRVLYTAFLPYDQYQDHIYQNFRPFEATLKEPLRQYISQPPDQAPVAEIREGALGGERLDPLQLQRPQKADPKWHTELHGQVDTYRGYYGARVGGIANGERSDILGDRQQQFTFGLNGTARLLDITDLHLEHRTKWGLNFTHYKLPLDFFTFDFKEGYPDQYALRQTIATSYSAGAFAQYPLDKFNRFELGAALQKRSYETPSDQLLQYLNDQFGYSSPQDRPITHFFTESSRTSVPLTLTFVRDTAIDTYETLGPWHGDRLRLELSVAPALGNLQGYQTVAFDARKYIPFGRQTLLATRVMGKYNTRANGDFVLLGGNDQVRNYPYDSIVGNRVLYGSAELRIPLGAGFDTLLGAFGPIRGLAFGDYAVAALASENLKLTRHEASYGFGVQFPSPIGIANFTWAKRKMDQYSFWSYHFYLLQRFNF